MTEYIRKNDALEIVKRTCGDYAAAFAEIKRLPLEDVAPVFCGSWSTTEEFKKGESIGRLYQTRRCD